MKLVGMMLVRNAGWIIRASVRASLAYCDEVLVLDHASTDNTRALLAALAAEIPRRVSVLHDDRSAFDEMDLRERLLREARKHGGTHVANVDDDEVMSAPVSRVLREHAAALPPGKALAVRAPRIWGGLDAVQIETPHYTEPWADVVFAIDAETTYRPGPGGYQLHGRRPHGVAGAVTLPVSGGGGQMHLQTASLRRFISKQAWYKMTELLRWPEQGVEAINARYDATVYGAQQEFRLAMVPASWWDGMAEIRRDIDLDAEPWQEREARRLWAQHGAAAFRGLDLYGVC